MSGEPLLADAAARHQALDPRHSFIVAAPAGSGKTGLITQRVLRLLSTVDNPEEILCITFTRKAAAEMRSRIHNALIVAAETPCPDNVFEAQTWDLATQALQRNKQMGWNLLDIPNRLRIKTIDSFCHYVAKQFVFDTPFGELPEQSEFPDIYYAMAARELLGKLEENTETARWLSVVVAHTSNDLSRCEKLFADMLGKREQWLPHIYNAADNRDYFQLVIEQLVEESLYRLEEQLYPLAGELLELADFAGTHAPQGNTELQSLKGIIQLPAQDLAGLGQWKNLLRLLLTKGLEPRKQISVREGFPANQKPPKERMRQLLAAYLQDPQLQALVLDAMHLPESGISEAQQPVMNALGQLLPQLTAILKTVFQQHNQCDYPETTLAALEALEPNPDKYGISDITLKLDYQLKHILVDEFQDTSGSQIKLLEQLIAGWQQDDGRTLFLVGDAMQSLYSFRDARVGLFINAQHQPIGPVQCKALYLSSNFRSKKGIVDWVNENFETAFPMAANINRGAVPYNHSVAVKDAEADPAVSFHGISCKEVEDYNRAEAEQIADICRQLKQQHPEQSVAILVRNRGHLKAIVPALKAAELHWEAIDIDPLGDRMPVLDLMSLSRALLSPADRIAWLAVLRAPFCGLSLKDLLVISNGFDSGGREPDCLLQRLQQWQQDSRCIGDLSPSGSAIINRVAPLLLQAWSHRGTDNFRVQIEQLWINLGGPATLLHNADIVDVRSYLDLLENWQEAGTIADWTQFQKAVDNLYASPNNSSANSQPSSPIQIMTIHKAKGLEFDQVLLPGLSKTPRTDDNPLLRWQEQVDEHNNASLLLAALGPHNEENDWIYRYLKYEQAVRTELENTRVLYVATTRAIKRLYLFAKVKALKDGWQKPAKTSLLAPIWPQLAEAIESHIYSVIELPEPVAGNENKFPTEIESNYIRQLPGDFEAASMPTDMMGLGVASHFSTQSRSQSPSDSLDFRARHQGTVLHRTLKQIAVEGIEHWPRERRLQLPLGWAATLKQLGILASAEELDLLSQSLESMLADPTGKWILGSQTDAQCEYALAYRDKKTAAIATSVIDRTFIADGIRWIIDYKFSRPAEGESQQDFMARQSDLYRSKLGHYAALYKQLGTDPVRCALYFPQTATFIEVIGD
ncbi:MAG: UvrD-helicase domain-containing protein [Porticoccaceae bacterium]|nr:UvrD-helicase domain-containing protein [Porticoccaceae bacterium]